MKLTRIDHTPQGGSCFSDWEWELDAGDFMPPSPAGYFTSRKIPANSMMVMHHRKRFIEGSLLMCGVL